ncbi:MAG: hypothetical protein C0592_07175 [Marinilabiliales bacterium]|nr:MAG: hypothetical protein C0592_07175 [Marinilabiliales bacterium]
MLGPSHKERFENTNVFVLSVIISVLLLAAMLINRFFGHECIEWKIAAAGLSLYSVAAPWLGRKSSKWRSFFARSALLFFLLIADCVLYLWLIPKCKLSEMTFYFEYVLFPLVVFLILSFIIKRLAQR